MQKLKQILGLAAGIAAAAIGTVSASYITTTVDRDSLYVGDPVTLSIALVVPPKATVVPPSFETDKEKVSVLDIKTSKTERKSSDSLLYRVLVTSYAVDPRTLAAMPFVVTSPQRAETLWSEIKTFRVISLVNSDTADVKGLKPPQMAGKAPLYWLWALVILAGLAAAAWFLKRFAGKKQKIEEKPSLPPYEEALQALARLAAKQLVIKGLLREHVFELSEIFKRYLGRRFDANAAEFTTEELVDWIAGSALDSTTRKGATWFFKTTDPIKFAKLMPLRDEVEQLEREVRAILEATKPVAPQASDAAATAGSAPSPVVSTTENQRAV